MATLAVIPARLGAKRLPRKPLRHLAGEPLIVRVWQRVMSMDVADDCVIATDSAEIQQVCEAAGAQVFLTSPAHPSGTDRVAEVALAEKFRSFDVILNVQGDEPYVSHEAAHGATSLVSERGFDISTAACRGDEADLSNPDVVKVVVSDEGRALLFSRAPIPWLRESDDADIRAPHIRRHIGLYAYTRAALLRWVSLPVHPLEQVERLEQLRPLLSGERIGVVDIAGRPLPGIDTEADLAFANEHWKIFTTGTLETRASR